ncbi:MAG: hypothetical protein Q8N59_00975 [bacterium]|nr:hypothetical protein [bacterium]
MQKNIKKIAVIGYGYVGKGMVNMFKSHYLVVAKDIDKEHIFDESEGQITVKSTEDDYSRINDADLAVICVPTPMIEESEDPFKGCDVSLVEAVVNRLETPVILIKSTVEPGTTDRLRRQTGKRIVFSPEYAGEGKYWSPYKFDKDMKECPFVIMGGPREDAAYILDLLVPILGPKKFYYQIKAKEAEVIKYMENTYFGVKVTFANEMRNICNSLGVDYYAVRTGWSLDPRVDPMHTMVFPDEPGFGGKCLPKDIHGIIRVSQKAGYEPEFIKEVIRSNDRFRNNKNNNHK